MGSYPPFIMYSLILRYGTFGRWREHSPEAEGELGVGRMQTMSISVEPLDFFIYF